jgi:spermidine/putrescine transport system substrate-binding protein
MKRWVCLILLLLVASARADDKALNLFAWSEYVPQEVIDGFTKETGIKVNYDTYASNEELISKLRAGGVKYDLIQPSEYTCEALIKAKRLEPIDLSQIPNFKNLLPEYTNMGFDPGNKFTIPWMIGSVGICVNTDKVHDGIHGYKDVFQPKFAGRIIVVNDSREMVSWALATIGIGPNDMSEANLAKAKPILAQWMKLIRKYDSDSPKTDLLAGNVDLGVVWSGEAALCWKENHKFAYILPAEGAHMFVDNLAIPKNAPNKAAAIAFMNYILKPEVSKLISDKFPYTNPNGEARKLLSKDQLDNPASYPKNPPKLDIFHDIGKDASHVEEMVTDLKNGG